MSLSQVAVSIPASPTVALNEEARLLREKGEPVIHLGIGEPKNKTPISAILSSAARLSSGDVKYVPTDGTPSLKKAIVRYSEENYDRVVAPQNIIVSDGAKQSLFNILFSLCNPQDEVVVLAPYWVSYPEMIKMVGAIPVIVTPEDGSFVPRFDEIERVVGSYTKAIIVNNPNNPSGTVFPEELISKIVDLCESKGIYMICDDIYHKLVFDGNQAPPACKYTKKDTENSKIILVNGVAKLYGMTGFRIGWVVAPRKLVEIMTNVQSQTTTCVSPVMQAAAVDVLLPPARGSGFSDENTGLTATDGGTRQKFRKKLREGALDDKEIEIDVAAPSMQAEIFAPPGMEELTQQIHACSRTSAARRKSRKLKISEALKLADRRGSGQAGQ